MITVTNKFGLPDAIVRAVVNDPYQRGDADFTVTQLLKPPQIAALERVHETPEDVSERIWALIGQSVHHVLERAGKGSNAAAIFEKRFSMPVTVDGITYQVSGQVDHFERGCLSDYKITSVFARGGKDEWTAQLNLLALLMAANNHEVARLQNVLILRDWRPKEALREDYPKSQVLALPIERWSTERAVGFLTTRIREHVAATARPCTPDEQWAQPDKWALMAKGKKRAIRLFEAKPDHIELGKGQFVEYRPGGKRRCENYCPVAAHCPQWQAERPADPPTLEEQLQQSVDQERAA